VDTAGLWSSTHPLDQAAMERAKRYLELGHLFIWVTDASSGLLKEDLGVWEKLKGKKVISAANKIDISGAKKSSPELKKLIGSESICLVSAKTREGIGELEEKISSSVLKHELNEESILITRMRHKRALEASFEALQKSIAAFSKRESLEFVALDLKQALDALKEFVGEIYSEDLLDVIFKEFCIGK
jgi:tRNA modification GTPase